MTQDSIDKLKKQIETLIKYCENRKNLNQRLNIWIGLAGILLGLGATVSGVLFENDARIAAIFGAGSATTQAVLFAYPVSKRERIHRAAIAKLQNLLSDIEIKAEFGAEEITVLLAELKDIRLKALLEDNINSNLIDENPQATSISLKPV